jgi:flavin-dependent thymidylate synthase
MQVTLINCTPNAAQTLIFAKSTRLELTPFTWNAIMEMHESTLEANLDYIANTVPSAWEFVNYNLLIEGVSRAYTHQQVRTRTASYAQQTMRVTNQSEFDYIFTEGNMKSEEAMRLIRWHKRITQHLYKRLVEDCGQQPEDARGILPTNISTNIFCNFNLRTISDIVKSRSGGRTQDEYQQVVSKLTEAVLAEHPWAEKFLFSKKRDYFNQIEEYAKQKFHDLKERGELLKIVDKMRKEF